MLVDGEAATVGTINFDYRSLLHHYENAVLLYRTQSIIDIERDFEEIFKVSQEIYPHTIKTSRYQSLIKEIVQLFAPMSNYHQDLAQGWIFFCLLTNR